MIAGSLEHFSNRGEANLIESLGGKVTGSAQPVRRTDQQHCPPELLQRTKKQEGLGFRFFPKEDFLKLTEESK